MPCCLGSSPTGWPRGRSRRSRPGPTSSSTASRPPGRAALDAWLAHVEPGARETFFLKLFVGGLTTPEVLLEHVAQFTADAEERLEQLRAIEPSNTNRGHDWFHRHMLRYAIERAEQRARVGGGRRPGSERGPR